MSTILCAVDFSDCSKHALRWAGALAVRRGMSLIVFHAVDPLLAHAARARMHVNLLDADAHHGLHDFAAEAFERCAVQPSQMRAVLVVGDPWRAILHACSAHDVGLLVMGTRGLGGVRKMLLGSTAERVLRSTIVPVLLVPEDDCTATVGDPTAAVKHVVAATDFGPSSKTATRLAAALAADMASELVLVNVVKPLAVPLQWQRYMEGCDEEQLVRARTQLARLAHDLLGDIPECAYVATLGHPPEEIANVGRDKSAGLIVMGLANRYDFAGARPGAVAYDVIRAARVPVLVVPRTSPLTEPLPIDRVHGPMTQDDANVAPIVHALVV